MTQRSRRPAATHYGRFRSALYWCCWAFGNGLFRLYFRMRVVARPSPFPTGPLVVAANHCSFLDPLLVALSLPRRVVFLVTSAVYYQPFYRPWMWLFGTIPVQDTSINVAALRASLAVLRSGGVVGIFPEGGISRDGRLRQGEIGVASLLLQAQAPVQTIGVTGTFKALPRSAKFPRPACVTVIYSDRIEPPERAQAQTPRELRRQLRDQVMAGIARVLPASQQPLVEAVKSV